MEELTRELNIQTDNLCTFLPQEKVGSFSGLDSIGLLRETQKALGGEKLEEVHKKLIDLQKKVADHTRQRDAAQEEVTQDCSAGMFACVCTLSWLPRLTVSGCLRTGSCWSKTNCSRSPKGKWRSVH